MELQVGFLGQVSYDSDPGGIGYDQVHGGYYGDYFLPVSRAYCHGIEIRILVGIHFDCSIGV